MSIQDELFKTIEILVSKYLEKQNISRTVASVVEYASDGKYKCNIDGVYYYLKCGTGAVLNNGTAVWVHIPNGKIGNAFIMGTRSNSEGLSDYNRMVNRPTINGRELVGNKTAQDLNLAGKIVNTYDANTENLVINTASTNTNDSVSENVITGE